MPKTFCYLYKVFLTLATLTGVIVAVSNLANVAFGNFFAEIMTTSNSFSAGTLLLQDSINLINCDSSPNMQNSITTNVAQCLTYPLSSTVGSSQNVAITNTGSLNPATLTLATTNTCGVQQILDTTSNANNGLIEGNVNFQNPGPTKFTDNPYSLYFTGNGWAETLLGPPNAFYANPGPQTFSIAAWFKTTTSGSIIGFTDAQPNTGQSMWDRQLWVDSTGHLVFGLYPTQIYELNTPNAYNDGLWHFVVVTVQPVNRGSATVLIYVDGKLIAGAPKDEKLPPGANGNPAQVYGGWWHLGWSNAINGWPDPPSNAYFTGNLADLAVFPTALTSAQITTLWNNTTQASFESSTMALAPKSFWPMQDLPTELYTGSLNGSSATFQDLSNNPGGNTGIGFGTFSVDNSGPLGSTATLFNGSSYAQTLYGPNNGTFYANPGPQTFSIAAWFKTTTSGSIIGFTDAQPNTGQSMWDRQLWVDSTGHLVFGLYPTQIYELNTPNAYNDGLWHFVVVTVQPVNIGSATVLIYVDGKLIAGAPGDENLPPGANGNPAQAYGGWWHLGWSNAINGWPDPPSNAYFTGSLAHITIFPSVLSATQVTELYQQSSPASYLQAVNGTVAQSNSYWPLTSVGIPFSPCFYVALAISTNTGSCIYPTSSSSCPNPPYIGGISVNVLIPQNTTSLTFTTALINTTIPANCINLHVSVAFLLSEQLGSFNAGLVHNLGYVIL
jgi:hypothetical protein